MRAVSDRSSQAGELRGCEGGGAAAVAGGGAGEAGEEKREHAAVEKSQVNEIVERAAKAAYTDWIKDVQDLEEPWDKLPQDHKDRMIESQRAAIASLREPTEAMIKAGKNTECEHMQMNCGADIAWQAMIDAALLP